MRSIRQKLFGKLYRTEHQAILWRAEDAIPVQGVIPETLYLRYALTVRGSAEYLVFPALVLDDYGNEIRKLKLYRWLREEGDYHPRSELFGYLQTTGQETQHFVREIELHYKYPIFAYPSLDTPLQDGIRVDAVVLADGAGQPSQIKRPALMREPLRRAAVAWWQISAETLPTFTPSQLNH